MLPWRAAAMPAGQCAMSGVLMPPSCTQVLWRRKGVLLALDPDVEVLLPRGAEAGVAYGEGFRQYKGHPYPQSPVLQGLVPVAK